MLKTQKYKFLIPIFILLIFLTLIDISLAVSYGEGAYGCGKYGIGCAVSVAVAAIGGPGAGKYVLPDLLLSQNLIKLQIKQGETKTIELKIKNTADSYQQVSIGIQDLKKFILISEPSFKLKPYEEKNITLDFTASTTELPDVYMGKLIVKSEYTQKIVRVIIKVLERKPLFDLKVHIPEEFKQVEIGKGVEADIIMYNFGDLMPVDVTLSYAIKDFENNTFNLKQETFAIEEQKKIRRRIKVPKNLKPDFYIFYALLEYEEQRAVSSDVFKIVEKKKFSLWIFLKEYKLVFILGLVAVISFIVIYQVRKKKRKKRKKKKRRSKN